MKEMFQIVFSIVFELYKENKSVNRKEVEKLTDISRSDATSILEEFLDRWLIKKKGNSDTTIYFLNEKDH
ncbi:hypothetical protein [Brassicibacter mesophilus]|uniref:hypothetical protein n=1 Tax=Brassicibacter mesophilus TaxID=745119 RepID=UPI003D1FB7FD